MKCIQRGWHRINCENQIIHYLTFVTAGHLKLKQNNTFCLLWCHANSGLANFFFNILLFSGLSPWGKDKWPYNWYSTKKTADKKQAATPLSKHQGPERPKGPKEISKCRNTACSSKAENVKANNFVTVTHYHIVHTKRFTAQEIQNMHH